MERLTRIIFLSLCMAALLTLSCTGTPKLSGNIPDNMDGLTDKTTSPQEEQPKEKEESEGFTGTLALVTSQDMKVELEAYKGELRIANLVQP